MAKRKAKLGSEAPKSAANDNRPNRNSKVIRFTRSYIDEYEKLQLAQWDEESPNAFGAS